MRELYSGVFIFQKRRAQVFVINRILFQNPNKLLLNKH